MEYRQFGDTELRVSEIGFGAWGIGGDVWGEPNDEESLRALRRAFDLGVSFYDTAYVYGDGHSEQLIGQEFTGGRRNEIVIGTKVPPKTYHWPPLASESSRDSFPADWLRSCTERSLRNLKTDYIDIQQLHCWTDRWLDEPEWLETLEKLRQEGKIRYFGISMNDWEPYDGVELVKSGNIKSVQVIYNIFEQRPEEKLFPAVQEKGVGIIARVPFEEGILTGSITPDTKFARDDWRKEWLTPDRLEEVDRRVKALRPFLSEDTPDLPTLALKYCLHHPAVSSVIPGMRSVRHVEANCRVSDARKRLSEQTVEELHSHAFVHGWRYPWLAGGEG